MAVLSFVPEPLRPGVADKSASPSGASDEAAPSTSTEVEVALVATTTVTEENDDDGKNNNKNAKESDDSGKDEKKQADLEFAKIFGDGVGSQGKEMYISSLGCRRPYPTRSDLYASDKSESDTLPVSAVSLLSKTKHAKHAKQHRKREHGSQQRQGPRRTKHPKVAVDEEAGRSSGSHQVADAEAPRDPAGAPPAAPAPAAPRVKVEPGLEVLCDELLHKIVCHLDPVSLSSMKATNKHFKAIIGREDGQVWREAMRNYCGEACASHLCHKHGDQRTEDLARQLVTLENLRWTKRTVGGEVEPSRCNFSSCAVGQKIVIFGGDHGQHALNDTYVLDLSGDSGGASGREASSSSSPTTAVAQDGRTASGPEAATTSSSTSVGPEWKRLHMRKSPPGRFGHTIRALNDHMCVLFGGCGNNGLFNDCYLLDLNDKEPQWKLVVTHPHDQGSSEDLNDDYAGYHQRETNSVRLGRNNKIGGPEDAPVERVWHAACVVQQSKLVVFGGCDNVGKLLDDMQVLDLSPLLPNQGKPVGSASNEREGGRGAALAGSPARRYARDASRRRGFSPYAPSMRRTPEEAASDLESPNWREVNPPTAAAGDGRKKEKKPLLVDQIIREEAAGGEAQAAPTPAAPRAEAPATRQQESSEDKLGLPLRWRKVETGGGFKPPARIGHSLVVMQEEGTKVVVFGGIANVGPVRARDNSSFVIDIGEKEPKWTKLNFTRDGRPHHANQLGAQGSSTNRAHAAASLSQDQQGESRPSSGGSRERGPGSPGRRRQRHAQGQGPACPGLPGAGRRHQTHAMPPSLLPSPRLDHVCWKLPGDRQIVFGGSPSVFGSQGLAQPMDVSLSDFGGPGGAGSGRDTRPEVFLLNTKVSEDENENGEGGQGIQGRTTASWTKIEMPHGGYEGPQSAWTHCACVMDHGTKCIVLGGSKGQDWLVNELHELSIM